MKTYQYKAEQFIPIDLEHAWDFFSNPKNLSTLTPKEMDFTILTELPAAIYENMIIDYTVKPLFGITLKWQTKIIEVDYKKHFTDIQSKGPFKLWKHKHEFEAVEGGVLMNDTVDYQMPFGILGTIGHSILVKKRIEGIFTYRKKVLDNLYKNKK